MNENTQAQFLQKMIDETKSVIETLEQDKRIARKPGALVHRYNREIARNRFSLGVYQSRLEQCEIS